MAKIKKHKRNYQKEYQTEQKKFTRITIKIEKEKAELFKQKLEDNDIKSVQDFFRNYIDCYLQE